MNGVNTFLEQKMKKKHVMEIICRDVFKVVFGSTEGPNVTLFKKFQNWPNIDRSDYKPCQDKRLDGIPGDLKRDTIEYVTNRLTQDEAKLPREDYREL